MNVDGVSAGLFQSPESFSSLGEAKIGFFHGDLVRKLDFVFSIFGVESLSAVFLPSSIFKRSVEGFGGHSVGNKWVEKEPEGIGSERIAPQRGGQEGVEPEGIIESEMIGLEGMGAEAIQPEVIGPEGLEQEEDEFHLNEMDKYSSNVDRQSENDAKDNAAAMAATMNAGVVEGIPWTMVGKDEVCIESQLKKAKEYMEEGRMASAGLFSCKAKMAAADLGIDITSRLPVENEELKVARLKQSITCAARYAEEGNEFSMRNSIEEMEALSKELMVSIDDQYPVLRLEDKLIYVLRMGLDEIRWAQESLKRRQKFFVKLNLFGMGECIENLTSCFNSVVRRIRTRLGVQINVGSFEDGSTKLGGSMKALLTCLESARCSAEKGDKQGMEAFLSEANQHNLEIQQLIQKERTRIEKEFAALFEPEFSS